MHEIEKNIPAPGLLAGRCVKYPFREMAVGDSFYVGEARLKTLTASASAAGRRLGGKFIARRWQAGVRVWRIA